MCGIAGFAGDSGSQSKVIAQLDAMAASIVHRGPDSHGSWINGDASLGLTHTRLAVLDLSDAGHQPMVSSCGRYVLVFNGEIYNHTELRGRLEAETGCCAWRGTSDSETLLESAAVWGLEATLALARGMFALALYDIENNVLRLARDRIGEKPLYYGFYGSEGGKKFFFSSELKAICALDWFQPQIDRCALALYFKYAYIPTPYSIYEQVFKLEPGVSLSVDLSTYETKKSRYFDLQDWYRNPHQNRFASESFGDKLDRLDRLISEVITEQSIADVPLGAFLSGGVDSSTIAAYMQEISSDPIKTFSIGYEDSEYDESVSAAAIAKHLGTDHSTIMVNPDDCRQLMESMSGVYDEPFADASQVPTLIVSRFAKENVTVALTGDAGDEIFGGYSRYLAMKKYWPFIRMLPLKIRRALADSILAVKPETWDKVSAMLKLDQVWSDFGYKVHKGASVLCSKDREELLENLISRNMTNICAGEANASDALPLRKVTDNPGICDLKYMMLSDALRYLPDNGLCKVDRAAMSVSLETRVPFLDPRLIEFAAALPEDLLINSKGETKVALRQLLYRKVPKELLEGPKKGFGIPIDSWLRGALKAWAESILDWKMMAEQGLLDVTAVKKLWDEHQSGLHNRQYELWTVIVFQQWLRSSGCGVQPEQTF